MFQAIPLPMWVFDIETYRFLDVNEAAIHQYGYTRDEFLGMTTLDIRPAEDADALRQNVKENAGRLYSGVWRHRTKDGREIIVDVTSNEIVFDGHKARIVTALDITERVTLERARDEHLRQMHLLANMALQLNYAQTIDETLDIITSHARTLIGAHQAVVSLSEDGGKTQTVQSVSLSDKYAAYRDYNAPPSSQGIYMLTAETNRPMRMTQAELEAHPRWRGFGEHADKHPPMNGWLIVPLVSRSGENMGLLQLSDKDEGEFTQDDEHILIQLAALAAVSVENTKFTLQLQRYADELEQRVSERTTELRLANQRLTELDALKTRFISEVSHELRNPITLLSFKVELLKRGGAAVLDRAIAGLEELTTQLLDLTEHVLDISRVELSRDRINLSPLDLAQLTTQIAEMYRSEAQSHALEFELDINPVPPVMGEQYQLTQVLTNLISNAIKYTPAGTIRISLAYDEPQNEVVLSVQDTGLGIDTEDVPYLFDRFYRGKNVSQSSIPGTGLGLPIVNEITTLHGGRIDFETARGVGSTFRVILPRA